MTIWDPKETLDSIGAGAAPPRKRAAKVGEAIRNELATLLISKVNDPSLQRVSISRVEVAADLSQAKIYFTVMGDNPDIKAVKEGFKRAGGFMRSHIARTLNLRFTPVLQFHHDTVMDKVVELEEILQEIADERKSRTSDP